MTQTSSDDDLGARPVSPPSDESLVGPLAAKGGGATPKTYERSSTALVPSFSGFGNARSWENSRIGELERAEARAWFITRVALVGAAAAMIALASLAPLKSAIPFLVTVDRASGDSEVVEVNAQKAVAFQEVLNKHWVTQYVRSRERYEPGLLQYDYDTVLALSDAATGKTYAHLYEGNDALDKRLGPLAQIHVEILSVTLPPRESGKAVVRFERTLRRSAAEPIGSVERFVATLAFSYHAPILAKERDVVENPLGFHVTAYTVDAELADRTHGGAS